MARPLSLVQLTLLLQHQGPGVATMDLPSEDGSASSGTCAEVVCAAYALSDEALQREREHTQAVIKYVVPHCNSHQKLVTVRAQQVRVPLWCIRGFAESPMCKAESRDRRRSR